MTLPETDTDTPADRALKALAHGDASVRLRAALTVGTDPRPPHIAPLLARCAIEPDFSVREMLTWALTRHPSDATLPGLLAELRSPRAQARGQALHTLSKTGDRRAWPALTRSLLTDADDEVARTAWRAAVALAPEEEAPELAAVLATQLGRGGRETRLSLSRALIALGDAGTPVLRAAAHGPDPLVRDHALVTEALRRDPDAGFDCAVEEAKRIVALGTAGREG
ncbi:HEAT repeat domain-containing protein [Streptomyces sp. NPDC002067]